MSDSKIDLEKLQEAQATSKTALVELKEALGDTVDNSVDPQALIDRVMHYMGSLQDQLGYLSDTVRNHISNGHIPPLKSREHMDRAIKNLGLDKEYEVAPKKVVYASDKYGFKAVIGKDVEI